MLFYKTAAVLALLPASSAVLATHTQRTYDESYFYSGYYGYGGLSDYNNYKGNHYGFGRSGN